MEHTSMKPCPHCHGSGKVEPHNELCCPYCHKQAFLERIATVRSGGKVQGRYYCHTCKREFRRDEQ